MAINILPIYIIIDYNKKKIVNTAIEINVERHCVRKAQNICVRNSISL